MGKLVPVCERKNESANLVTALNKLVYLTPCTQPHCLPPPFPLNLPPPPPPSAAAAISNIVLQICTFKEFIKSHISFSDILQGVDSFKNLCYSAC